MTATYEERAKISARLKDMAECEFDFEIYNVSAAIGADRHFPQLAWHRLADLVDPDASEATKKEVEHAEA